MTGRERTDEIAVVGAGLAGLALVGLLWRGRPVEGGRAQ